MSYFQDDDSSQIRGLKDKISDLQAQILALGFSSSEENVLSGQSTFPGANPVAQGGGTGGIGGPGFTFPLNFPELDVGSVGLGTVNLDFSQTTRHSRHYTLTGDTGFAFNLPPVGETGYANIILDQDATGGHNVTFPVGTINKIAVENAINTVGNARTSVIVKYAFGEYTVFLEEGFAGGGTPGTIPDGSAQFQHLEWNGAAWIAQQPLSFGPISATNGQLKFPNDVVGPSWRNVANDGNLELKVDSGDFFDFTETNNGPISIKLRAQHATDPDNTITLTQFPGINGVGQFFAPNQMQFLGSGGGNVFNYDQNRIETNVNINPDDDGTISLGNSVNLRYFAIHAASFVFDTTRRLDFNTGGGVLSVNGVGDSFNLSVDSVVKMTSTATLTSLSGDVDVFADLSIGGKAQLAEIAAPTTNPPANTGWVYAKEVVDHSEPFWEDELGLVTNMLPSRWAEFPASQDVDLATGGFSIIGGGAGEGISNIGLATFVDNAATPTAPVALYSDGTDLFANTGGTVVNLSDIGSGTGGPASEPYETLVQTPTIAGGALGINLNFHTHTVNVNQDITTINFFNVPPAGQSRQFTIRFNNSSSTATRTIQFPVEAASEIVTLGPDESSRLVFHTEDNGATYEVETLIGAVFAGSGGLLSNLIIDVDKDWSNRVISNIRSLGFNRVGTGITTATGMELGIGATDSFQFVFGGLAQYTMTNTAMNFLDNNLLRTGFIQMKDQLIPPTGVAGHVQFYAKADTDSVVKLFYKDSANVEVGPLGSGAGTGASSLNDLTDVTLATVLDNQFLQFNSTSGQWENVSITPGAGEPSDGDKGDILVSGSGLNWQIDTGAIIDANISGGADISKTKISDTGRFGASDLPLTLMYTNTSQNVTGQKTFDGVGTSLVVTNQASFNGRVVIGNSAADDLTINSEIESDVILQNGNRIAPDSSTSEIGIFTNGNPVATGANGSLGIPINPGPTDSSSQADIDFGGKDGCIGIYENSGGTPILVIRANGVWRTILLGGGTLP